MFSLHATSCRHLADISTDVSMRDSVSVLTDEEFISYVRGQCAAVILHNASHTFTNATYIFPRHFPKDRGEHSIYSALIYVLEEEGYTVKPLQDDDGLFIEWK